MPVHADEQQHGAAEDRDDPTVRDGDLDEQERPENPDPEADELAAPPCAEDDRSFTDSGGGCCWAFARPPNATATRAIATTRPILLDVMEISFPPEFVGNNGEANSWSASILRLK